MTIAKNGMLLLLLLLLLACSSVAQDLVIPLFPEGIPCANELQIETTYDSVIGRRVAKVHEPEIHAFFPSQQTERGTGVIICPGGGYTIQAWDWEGTKVAEWFQSLGITAFVLRYRLPHWETDSCRSKVALMDAQRAVRTVRSRAIEWRLDPDRIGIMGFSAGGHLASSVATHFNDGYKTFNSIDSVSCRPDFAILMYPVITMDTSFAHMGSRKNLIGENPLPALVDYYSSEKQVTRECPPTLLVHASDDRGVLPANSIRYYEALLQHDVPAALHMYSKGGHGFSFGEGRGAVEGWPVVCQSWLEEQALLPVH
ncbi:MAG: alpha/beta hydrolase [Saprospiraceae bacterium]|nr:alpha/beta hydrolase [Saprospiraceae bacterium]